MPSLYMVFSPFDLLTINDDDDEKTPLEKREEKSQSKGTREKENQRITIRVSASRFLFVYLSPPSRLET